MNKLKARVQTVGAICIGCILVVCIYLLNHSNEFNDAYYDRLVSGWSVQMNDIYEENVDLSDFYFPGMNRGDYAKMQTTLPASEIANPVLCLYTIHSEVSVSLDGEEIYHYGRELNQAGKLLGFGYHYIDLPENYGGSSLTIELWVTENNAFTYLETPEIANELTVIRDYIIQKKVPLAINLFLIVFGVCLLFVCLLFIRGNMRFGKLICVACFSVGIGFWSLCNYDLITLFTYDLRVKSYLEFTALYFSPLFVMLYFRQDANRRSKAFRYVYRFMVLCQIVFLALAIGLQMTNTLHFPAMLKYEHMILVLACSAMITAVAGNIYRHRVHNKVLLFGITLMVFIGLTDIVRFNMEKYHVTGSAGRYTSNLCVGALIFVLAQLIDFAMEISQALYESARQETLERMAYRDELTGVYNRRKCEEEWDRLEKADNYGMLAFDLNHLKKTNDTRGHDKGDLLIKSFAQCIQKVFGDYGIVGRMGGDEFVVIFPDITSIHLDELIDIYQREIKVCNDENPGLEISAAYGFCDKKEFPLEDARGIYRRADARMYEQKMSMKCQRKE